MNDLPQVTSGKLGWFSKIGKFAEIQQYRLYHQHICHERVDGHPERKDKHSPDRSYNLR